MITEVIKGMITGMMTKMITGMILGLLRLVPGVLVRCIDAHLRTLGDDTGLTALSSRDAGAVY